MPITPLKEAKGFLSFFILGAPGTGKSTFCAQIAEHLPKKTLFIDYDGKLAAQANLTPAQRAKIDVWTPDVPATKLGFVDKKQPTKEDASYLSFIETINSLEQDPFPYSFIVIDTLTNLAEDLERFVQKKTGYTQGSSGDASFAYWNNIGSNLIKNIKDLKCIPCMLAINVHTQHEKDDITGVILTTPTVSSKKRYILEKEFAEVYHFEGSNGKEFVARVERDRRYPGRTGFNVKKPIATLKELQEAILKEVKG